MQSPNSQNQNQNQNKVYTPDSKKSVKTLKFKSSVRNNESLSTMSNYTEPSNNGSKLDFLNKLKQDSADLKEEMIKLKSNQNENLDRVRHRYNSELSQTLSTKEEMLKKLEQS